jgi:GTP cyclohydrolase II
METVETTLSTQHGKFRIICYQSQENIDPDFALIHGNVVNCSNVLTRVQSECLTGHVLQSLSCDCYEQLQEALELITASENGILIYLRQEGRGIGLAAKLQSYILQKQGLDTVEANLRLGYKVDERNYDSAAMILKNLKVESICLITNNPKKVAGLEADGINVSKVIGIPPHVRDENKRYLKTKIERMGHTFKLTEE